MDIIKVDTSMIEIAGIKKRIDEIGEIMKAVEKSTDRQFKLENTMKAMEICSNVIKAHDGTDDKDIKLLLAACALLGMKLSTLAMSLL